MVAIYLLESLTPMPRCSSGLLANFTDAPPCIKTKFVPIFLVCKAYFVKTIYPILFQRYFMRLPWRDTIVTDCVG